MLMISLVSLFALGCGSSQEDFVFTGTNNNGAGVGNVVFQFVKPQAATVPADTATLAFDFYNTANPANGTVIFTATSAFANTVTVINVPVEARSVVITAYDADGHPKATITDEIVVLPGVNNPTDLSNALVGIVTFDAIDVTPDPVALILGTQNDTTEQLVVTGFFSNGESIAFTAAENAANGAFVSNAPAVATVAANGLVSAVSNGSTTIDVDYTVDGVTRSLDGVAVNVTGGVIDDVLLVTPDTLTVADGTSSGAPSATFSANGANPVDVTGDPELTYALQQAVAGITVNANTGVVTVAAATPDATTATVVATYLDANGNTDTDTIAVTVGAPAILDVAFAEPAGDTLELPSGGFDYQLVVFEYFADNTVRTANLADYEFTSGNVAAGIVDNSAGFEGILDTVDPGQATISVRRDGEVDILDSFTLTSSDTTIDSTTVAPNAFTLAANGATATYRVTAEYANGRSEDITAATQNSVYAIFDSGTSVLTLNSGFTGGTITSGATTGTGTYGVFVNGGFTTPVTFVADLFDVTVTP
jgi:hypothetical protein